MKRGATVAVFVLCAVAIVGGAAWYLLQDPSVGSSAKDASFGSRDLAARRDAPEPAVSRPSSDPAAAAGRPISSVPFDPQLARGELFVSGTVFEDSGRPVSGARVDLLVDSSRSLTGFQEGALVAGTLTNDAGNFQFEDAARLKARDRYLLRVRHPDYQLERVSPIDPAVPATLRRDILLRRTGGGLAGQITDEYGTPLNNAVVAVYDAVQASTEYLGALEKEAAADATGRFRLSSLRAGFKTVRVTAPGYTTAARTDFEVREGAMLGLDFRLARGRSISGNVVGRDSGQGVAGALVVARLLRLDGQRGVDPADAEKHAAEIAKVAAAANEEAAARAAKRAAGAEPAADSEAEPATAEDELRRQRAQWATLRKAPPGIAKTDAEGAFEIQGLEDGAYEIIVRAAGYQESSPQGAMVGESVLVEISRNGALRGRCIDAATGEPVTAFTLAAVAGPEQRFIPSSVKRGFSGPGTADGAFEYGDLAPGRWQLVGEAPGYAGGRSEVVQLSMGETREGLVVKLERGVEVNGKVVDASGKGVGGVGVHLEPSDLAAHPLAALMMRQVRRDRISATSDAGGRYRFPNVLAGSYHVETAEGALAPSKTAVFAVGAAGPVEAPDLLASRGATMTGRVLRKSDRAPDPEATVRVAPYATAADASAFTAGSQREAATDAAGRFVLDGLPPGNYRVMVVRRENVQNFAEILGTVARNQGSPPTTYVLTDGASLDVGDL